MSSSMKEVVRLFQLEQNIIPAKKEGNLSHALGMYNEILQIKQTISNRLGLAKSYVERGELLENYGDRNSALESYLVAAEIAKNSNNPNFLAIVDSQIKRIQQ